MYRLGVSGTVNIVLIIPYRNSSLKTEFALLVLCIYIYTHISLRARGDLSPGLDFIGRNGQKFGDRYHRSDSWYPGVGNGQAVRDAREKGEE